MSWKDLGTRCPPQPSTGTRLSSFGASPRRHSRTKAKIICARLVDHYPQMTDLWSTAEEEAYGQAVENAVFGYGRLQPLLEMPAVENIEISGCDSVVVQYGDGRREKMPPVAASDEELVEAVRFLGQNTEPSRPFDDA